MTADEDFNDVIASLRWAAELPLTPEQRLSLKELCCQIAGISGAGVTSFRLKEEAEAKRQAIERAEAGERRLAELELREKNKLQPEIHRNDRRSTNVSQNVSRC